MSLFTKYIKMAPTKEEIEKAARELIRQQLVSSYSYHNFGIESPPPAREYANKILEKQIKSKGIQKDIDVFLQSLQGERFEAIVARQVQRRLEKLLKEDLIEDIVKKINKHQLGGG